MEFLRHLDRSVWIATAAVVLASSSALFLVKLWHARMFFRKLQESGIPMPPHSFAFGHLLFLQSIFKSVPVDLHKMLYFGEIMQRDFAKQGIYYIDLWPFSEPFVMVMSPALATQATQTNSKISMQRPPQLKHWFAPLAGGPNLFDLPEKEWKPWRQLFNQGFGNAQNLALVPVMVEETLVYRDTLRRYAQEGVLFKLDAVSIRYIMDVMGRTVLNASLKAQKGYNPLVDSLESQVTWHLTNREADPLQYLNFARPIVQWWNGRKMDQFVGKELDKRYQEYKEDSQNVRSKSVIDLILQAYMADSSAPREKLDRTFRTFATRQIRLFAFAGQGSTSATICYAIHLLSTNPDTLARIRAEHDAIFGTDLSTAPSQISQQPRLLNQLSYTKAVIKETTRLFPAASSVRQGYPGEDLIDEHGRRYPTDNVMMLILHPAMGRSPNYWPKPDDFIPDRWLVEPGHELYPTKGAWRPFEWGPRNCIGQDLVMVEMKVALVMTVREFDFQPAYDEWDAIHPRKGLQTFRGDRAYQVEAGSAHPSEKYPCRVSVRKTQK